MFEFEIERDGKKIKLTSEELVKANEVFIKNFYCNEILDVNNDFFVPESDVNKVATLANEEYEKADGRIEYECLQDAYDVYVTEVTANGFSEHPCSDITLAKRMWNHFGDVVIDEKDRIDEDWFIFDRGTSRFDIWTWFEETFNLSVALDLMHSDED